MNDPPVADGHDVITSDDTAVTITLSGSDPNGDSLTFSIVSGPVHGSLGAVTPAGAAAATVVYTPDASFNGGDSFTYKASDGVLDSTVASVSITVIPTPAALFEPPTIEAARGTEFTLALAVDPGRYGISGGEVLLEFPPSVFEVVSYTPGSLLGLDSIVGVQQVDQSSGTIRLSLARVGATPVPTPPGSFLVVRFRVALSAPGGSYAVTLAGVGLADENFANMTVYAAVPAVITVPCTGDINADCTVNYQDLAILGAAYGTTSGDVAYDPRADLNGDGLVDYKDLTILGAHYGQ